jgi:pyridoxamine 5'-phosphate oxidase
MTMSLDVTQLNHDPYQQFLAWFTDWRATQPAEPHAMTVATADAHKLPWIRTVLLRGHDERGFVFYTNYLSNKAEQLALNPQAALHFLWQPLGRQILIQGNVEKTSAQESDAYFQSRPRESQIGAWASHQSTLLKDRAELMQRVADLTKQYEGKMIPTPPHWGGYRVTPERYEFWQLGEHRLHDRFIYLPKGNSWEIQRLNP